MRIVNESLLDQFRASGMCGFCGCWTTSREPHHVRTKGSGRIDAPYNLVALCFKCHRHHHDGNEPTTATCLTIICKRMGITYDQLAEELYRIRNARKETDPNETRPEWAPAYHDSRGDKP